MESIEDVLLSFLNTEGWHFTPDKRADLFRGVYQGQSGKWPCFFWVREDVKQLVFYSLMPFVAPEMSRIDCMKKMMFLNMDQVIGSFEMDPSTGSMRMRVALDAYHMELGSPHIRRMVLSNLLSFDKALPELRQIVQGALRKEA